jgi:hypothetical protein
MFLLISIKGKYKVKVQEACFRKKYLHEAVETGVLGEMSI